MIKLPIHIHDARKFVSEMGSIIYEGRANCGKYVARIDNGEWIYAGKPIYAARQAIVDKWKLHPVFRFGSWWWQSKSENRRGTA